MQSGCNWVGDPVCASVRAERSQDREAEPNIQAAIAHVIDSSADGCAGSWRDPGSCHATLLSLQLRGSARSRVPVQNCLGALSMCATMSMRPQIVAACVPLQPLRPRGGRREVGTRRTIMHWRSRLGFCWAFGVQRTGAAAPNRVALFLSRPLERDVAVGSQMHYRMAI